MNTCTFNFIPENVSVAILIELLSLFYLPDYLYILLYHIGCYALLPGCFSFQLLYFQLSLLFDSLLKFLLCLSILSHNSFSILITNVLNSLSGKLFISVSLFIFSGAFSCSYTSSSVFLPCLTFSISTYLDETIAYCSLERVSFCRSVHSLHRPKIFGGSTGFDLKRRHLSSGYTVSCHLGRRWGWR